MNLDPTLLKIFESEQQEHVGRMRALLEPGIEGGALGSREGAEEALRRAHTLKGAARAVGVRATELLAHRIETVFARVRDGALRPDEPVAAAIRRALDAAEDVLASVVADRPEPDTSAAVKDLEAVLGGPRSPSPERSNPPAPERAQPAPPRSDSGADMMRVSTKSIDDLVRASSELLGAASAEVEASRDMAAVAERLGSLSKEWSRLRRRAAASLRPLREDSRLAPVIESLDFMDRELESLRRDARSALQARQRQDWRLEQLAAEQHRAASRVRMTPAETVFGAFGPMVRDLAHTEGKEIAYRAEGLDILADRLVLQALKDPVMHLLRNAVAHGLEAPHDRIAKGKPPESLVLLRLETRGDRLSISVEDDGAGIDPERVAKAAARAGLIDAHSARSLSWQGVVDLILQPGFSTSQGVSRLAGRGMGMSVVQEAVARLNGEMTVNPRRGSGTIIALAVPLSVSTQQVLLVSCRGNVFAIPSAAVRQLRRVRVSEIEIVDGSEAIRSDAGPVPLARFSDLLGLPGESQADGGERPAVVPVAVIQSGIERAGIVVDALVDQREAVVKDLGLDAAQAGMAGGGIALADGAVAVLLNPAALIETFRRSGKQPGLRPVEPATPPSPPSILVVDDSITTRSLEKSMLEAHGYRVRVAVDGLEALDRMREEKPDLVITDVMMPRLDGLQLLDHIKHDREFAGVPVIVVTSLDKREEQERGLSLGADAYIVKQKFNQRELLNTIRQIL